MRRLSLLAALAAAGCAGEGGGGPALRLALEAPASAVAGPVTVIAVPSVGDRIRRVDFTLDGDLPLEADITPPFSVTLVPGVVADGAHAVSARAVDGEGKVITAETTVVLDNAPPAVIVATPEDARVLPPGEVVVRLAAEDPAGVAGGKLRLDGGPTLPLAPSLSATLQLPSTAEFPVEHVVSWELDDLAGNRATGEIPLTLTRERAVHRIEVPGLEPQTAAGFDGRVFAWGSGASHLFAFGGEGEPWDLDLGWKLGHLVPLPDGGALVVLSDPERLPGAFVRRLGPDGATVFETPDIGEAVYSYARPSPDGVTLASRIENAANLRCSIVAVAPDGNEQTLVALPDGWIARRVGKPEAAGEGGVVALLFDLEGTALPRVASFDALGRERWSVTMPEGNAELADLWVLGPDLVALPFVDHETGDTVVRAFGPTGEAWSLAEAPNESLRQALVRDGALWLKSEVDIVHAGLRRVHVDGTVSYHRVFDETIWSWDVDVDGFLVHFAEALVRFDPRGEERWRFDLPAGDEVSVLYSVARRPDGSTWVIAPGNEHPSRLFHLDPNGAPTFLQRLGPGAPLKVLAAPDDGGAVVPAYIQITAAGNLVLDIHPIVR